ncbi:MAG: DUF2318 domain-containing protein [Clostridia bacterium]|nr:DUF2318 domain-containing protein [Clostridia bacterium]
MLEALASTLRSTTEAALLAALIMLSARKDNRRELQGLVWRGIGSGFLVSIALVPGSKYLHLRDMLDALVLLGAILGEGWLLWWLFQGGRQFPEVAKSSSRVEKALLFLVTSQVVLPRGMELVNFPATVFIQSTDFLNTELLLKASLGFVGVLLAFLLGLAFNKAGSSLSRRDLNFFASVMLVTLVAGQGVGFLQVLFATEVLPLTPAAMKLMIPLVNNSAVFFYTYLAVAGLLVLRAAALRWKNRPDELSRLNPAQVRKAKAARRRDLRWSGAASALIFGVVFLMAINFAYANRKVALSPATPLTAVNGMLELNTESLMDGKLHRYVFTTGKGTQVRFIAIRKGKGGFGVALDACNICGPVGYYQRKDDVVCANCDVVINVATIGFGGGCNPVPLQSKVKQGKVLIVTDELEREQKRFQK